MYWHDLISDFPGLSQAVIGESSLNKVADFLGRHKSTVAAWPRGVPPSDQSDVAWLLRRALEKGIDVSRFQTFAPIYDFSPMLAYEEKSDNGPPDLSWLTRISSPPPVKTAFCGIELDCPLGVSSSPLLSDERWTALILDLSFGLSTFKTRRTGSKRSWDPPQIAFVLEPPDLRDYDCDNPPEVLVTFNRSEAPDPVPSLVNSIGVPSEPTVAWQHTYERIKHHERGRFVGLSVMGDGNCPAEVVKDFTVATEKARDVLPPFVELNPSCPNLEKGTDVWHDVGLLQQICSEAHQVLSGPGIPLVLKLPHLNGNKLREVIKAAGKFVEAVSFCNTIRVKPLAKDHRDDTLYPAFTSRRFGGLSGPCTLEKTLRGLKELVRIKEELEQDFSVIAVGGVTTASHAVECLNAGADIVQVCTSAMFDPLLAWKIRFHMKQFDLNLSSTEAADLLWPTNNSEAVSFRNAWEAVNQIQRRFPQRAVSWDLFQTKWNQWKEQQPSIPAGRAHRLPAPRTISQWTREFTQ